MKIDSDTELAQRLGADRVLSPPGSLPQPAERLDASGPVRPFELELEVERLCLDSTSFRELRDRAGADPELIAKRIVEVVEARGKMHNPATDSGGILTGAVTAIGDRFEGAPEIGARIATLGSLTLTPLRLERVTRVDPDSPQVDVDGTAYVFARAPWAPLPDDIPLTQALEILDVCAVATQTRRLAFTGATVYVLGAGHAGRLALAAAQDAAGDGLVVAVDVDGAAVNRAKEAGLCDLGVVADLRDPVATAEALRAGGAPPADLTVVVVNAAGCEPAAILITAEGGTVLFFSMATRFGSAALAADGIGSDVRMVIGSGYAPDRGAYALELVRGSAPLRDAFGIPTREAV